MKKQREKAIKCSNNQQNPGQNICCLEVIKYLRLEHMAGYLHFEDDVLRTVKLRYKVKRKKKLEGKRLIFVRISGRNAEKYLITTDNHVLLIDFENYTTIDTADLSIFTKVDKVYSLINY